MAQSSTVTNEVRTGTTRLLRDLQQIDGLVNLIEATGPNDAARLAFFESFFDTQQDYDITIGEFTAAVAALRDIQAEYDENLPALFKLWL